VLLDTRGENRFTDYFIICSADSPRQMQAVRDEIVTSLKKIGTTLHHDEGDAATGWLLLDYGDIVIHIFGSREREFYQLDQLWADAATLLRIQ
jgi:ribosome-associated protein